MSIKNILKVEENNNDNNNNNDNKNYNDNVLKVC